MINFQGFGVYSTSLENHVGAYTQVFYNGAIECVNTSMLGHSFVQGPFNRSGFIDTDFVAKTLFQDFSSLMSYRCLFDNTYPVVLYMQFLGVHGLSLVKSSKNFLGIGSGKRLNDDALKFTPITLDGIQESYVATFKPWLDALWRAFGNEKCPQYRSDLEYCEYSGTIHK